MFQSETANWTITIFRITIKLAGLYILSFRNFPLPLILFYLLLMILSEIISIGGMWLVIQKNHLYTRVYSFIALTDAFFLMIVLYITQLIQTDLYLFGYVTTVAVGFYAGLLPGLLKGGLSGILYLWLLVRLGYPLTFSLFFRSIIFLALGFFSGWASHIAHSLYQEKEDLVEQKTHEKEVNRIRNQFLSLVSHNLRTPMVEILGFIEWLKKPDLKAKQRPAILKKLSHSSQRLNQSINRLTEIALLQAGELTLQHKETDIVSLIKGVIEELSHVADLKSIQITFKSFHPQVQVYVDQERFKHAIWSVLENAVKFSPEKSLVQIDLTAQGNELIIAISDQGPGIPYKKHKDVLKGFRKIQDHYIPQGPGLGIGLYLAEQILKVHGGRIELQSQPGKGSTFKLILPWSTVGELFETL